MFHAGSGSARAFKGFVIASVVVGTVVAYDGYAKASNLVGDATEFVVGGGAVIVGTAPDRAGSAIEKGLAADEKAAKTQ